jgi:hypothetical protein
MCTMVKKVLLWDKQGMWSWKYRAGAARKLGFPFLVKWLVPGAGCSVKQFETNPVNTLRYDGNDPAIGEHIRCKLTTLCKLCKSDIFNDVGGPF